MVTQQVVVTGLAPSDKCRQNICQILPPNLGELLPTPGISLVSQTFRIQFWHHSHILCTYPTILSKT